MKSAWSWLQARWQALPADMRWGVSVFLVVRVALSAWASVVLHVYPVYVLSWDDPVFALYQRGVPDGIPLWDALLWPWYRWDTGMYLKIALEGYGVADGRTAFAPLYPLLIH